MREIKHIVVHGAWTPADMDIGAAEIREWHLAKGWRDIGYHWVIRRDGTIERGRPVEQIGAHVAGRNRYSIGICLVGGKHPNGKDWQVNYTAAQWRSLEQLVRCESLRYPGAQVVAHSDLARRKCCGFDVKAWASTL